MSGSTDNATFPSVLLSDEASVDSERMTFRHRVPRSCPVSEAQEYVVATIIQKEIGHRGLLRQPSPQFRRERSLLLNGIRRAPGSDLSQTVRSLIVPLREPGAES